MNAKQKAQLHSITSRTLNKTVRITAGQPSLEALKDVPVTISVGLGKQIMSMKELLSLKEGDQIPLNKKIGDPLDVYVNQELIGYGELVVSEEGYGVVITSLVGD